MNSRQLSKHFHGWLFRISLGCAAVGMSSTLTPFVAADEPGAPQREVVVPVRGQPKVFKSSDQTLIGGPLAPSSGPESGPPEALQKRMRELQQQQQQLAKEYQEAMQAIQQSLPRSMQLDIERQELQKRLAEANAQIADLAGRQERTMVAPLPDNAELRAFTLKYVKPEDVGQALHNITGGGGPRIAVDERTNVLVIAGTTKQIDVAEQLINKLDQPGKAQQAKATETLQVRMVWLLDGLPDTEGRPADLPIISPPVVDALRELGFETPRVMCQQLTTLTLDKGNRGKFQFRVPVLIHGDPWQFQGQGEISPVADDRYTVDFNLNVQQAENSQDCQLGGSIVTPLAHYTVMGTTTFVAKTPADANSPTPYLEQHLSAFVVYLDRAKEFGDADATAKPTKKSDKAR